jgi:hypothetical protein
VAEAEATVRNYGLGDRLSTHAGDFFDSVPEGGDTHLLSMVLHDWNDAEATALLSNIARPPRREPGSWPSNL